MKIDRVGGAPEIPQNNDPNQIQEGSESPKGISGHPDGLESFSPNANPFSQDSIFSTHEHQPQGRPFTDPSFHPGKAQGRPFQDQGAPPLEAAPTDPKVLEEEPSEAATEAPAEVADEGPEESSTGAPEQAALPLETNLPPED